MTRINEPRGSVNLLSVSLPVRPMEPDSPPTVDGGRNECIADAVSAGKNISGFLADALKQSTLAGDEDSNLHQLVRRAEELCRYQSPVEFTIGLVGDSGVGKSSLINSLLDEEAIAKTSGNGSATTTVVTEYRKKRETDVATYTAEIECTSNDEIEDLLRQSVVDYRRYHLLDPEIIDGPEEERLRRKAQVAWNTLEAAFKDQRPSEALFQNPDVDIDFLHQTVLGWKNEIAWPASFNTQRTVITTANDKDCSNQISQFLSAGLWPFVKVVRIYLAAPILRNGVVLVDLPGFRDVNSARVRITETRLHRCDEIFVVADIGRAATNVGVEDIIVRHLGQNFDGLRRSQGVAIICTKSEDYGGESEVLRDVPQIGELSLRTLRDLETQIRDAEDNDRPDKHLRATRNHVFISARNGHVKRQLEAHYAAHARTRRIEVFCVSNSLYRKARKSMADPRHRRSSSNAVASKGLAARQQRVSSGIDELREFCQGIPRSSQIAETRHFLDTKLVALLEQADMWLTASVAGVAANRQAEPGFLGELQEELQAHFNESLQINNEGLSDANIEMLRRPLAQGRGRWEQEALSVVGGLERWSVQTLMAFWNRDGHHHTRAQEHTDWNANIIEKMVEDFQPSEELFNSRCQELFETLKIALREELSNLLTRLGELRGVEAFRQTFPRRRRYLSYEVEIITTSFSDKLQMLFHDFLQTHGTSYVMRQMLPMYSEGQSGDGTKKRILARLRLQVTGDRNNVGLFKAISKGFMLDTNSLLEETDGELRRATEKCCEDIRNDLELLRGENTPVAEQDGVLEMMFTMLEEARTNREEVVRVFEAGVAGPAAG